jgi:Uma2 family endonuclease
MAIAEAEVQQAEIKPGARVTEEELLRLPKDGRKWELVDGRLTEVPTSIRHEEIGINLIALFLPFARGRGILTAGQGGFRMLDGNIRAPDVSYTRKERFPGGHAPDTFGDLAPDLCVEVISPSEKPADMAQKVREYFEGGAEQVWHVFPEAQRVIVFTSSTETRTLNAEDALTAESLLPGFSCRVSDLFVME